MAVRPLAGCAALSQRPNPKSRPYLPACLPAVWDRLEQENSAWFEEYYAQQYAARPAHSSTA